jgi:hypothetical protein
MPVAVKLSDSLAEEARTASAGADRSLTGQVEHWARLGKAVEPLFTAPTIAALKKSGGDIGKLDDEQEKARVLAILEAFHRTPREALGEKLQLPSKSVIEPDPEKPGGFIRIQPDGTVEHGLLKDRRFIPA